MTAISAADDKIILVDFSATSHKWEETNDPVMGGQSTGTFTINNDNGVGRFVGHVAIVPFLHAPGFIKAETLRGVEHWPDISSCTGLEFNIESHNSYSGYRVSFGKNRPPDAMRYIYGYKANLRIIHSSSKEIVQIPFTDFTDKWDAGTGNAITTCKENSSFCPDEHTLKSNLYSIGIWGEGIEGDVDLDLYSIQAYGCTDNDAIVAANNAREELKAKEVVNNNSNTEDKKESSTATATTTSSINGDEILLEDFSNPTNNWTALNDPVMGGQSTSTVVIDKESDVAMFKGEVHIVPFLNAPGFITMMTGGFQAGNNAIFSDVSMCNAFKVVLRSSNPSYKGYRISFGHHHEPDGRYSMGYKAPTWNTKNIPSNEFGEMIFPFDTFSAKWDDKTGDITESCTKQNLKVCPDRVSLSDLQTMSFWGEGVIGKVDLEIKSISAVGCSSNNNDYSSSNSDNKIFLGMSNDNNIKNNNNDQKDNIWILVGANILLAILPVTGIGAYIYYYSKRHRRGHQIMLAEQDGGTYETLEDMDDGIQVI